MRNISRFAWAGIVMVLATSATTGVEAQISAELAKKCRALMIKAHPTVLYGKKGSEAAQRAYFKNCISKNGNMPDAADSGGSPSEGSPPPSKPAGAKN